MTTASTTSNWTAPTARGYCATCGLAPCAQPAGFPHFLVHPMPYDVDTDQLAATLLGYIARAPGVARAALLEQAVQQITVYARTSAAAGD